jgi:hypothetical protein
MRLLRAFRNLLLANFREVTCHELCEKGKRKGRSVTTSAPSPPYLADCARCVPRFSRGFLSMMRKLQSLLSETPSGGERIVADL